MSEVKWECCGLPKDDRGLSLLVIDLGDSCVVKVQKGILTEALRERMLPIAEPSEGDERWADCKAPFTWAINNKSFADIRAAIDALEDKPVPRIEQDDVAGYERYRLVLKNGSTFPLPVNPFDALSELAGHPLPIYQRKRGKWVKLYTPHLGTEFFPFTAWRYTKEGR